MIYNVVYECIWDHQIIHWELTFHHIIWLCLSAANSAQGFLEGRWSKTGWNPCLIVWILFRRSKLIMYFFQNTRSKRYASNVVAPLRMPLRMLLGKHICMDWLPKSRPHLSFTKKHIKTMIKTSIFLCWNLLKPFKPHTHTTCKTTLNRF